MGIIGAGIRAGGGVQPDLSGIVLHNQYRLLDIVGHGRFGAVYLARDIQTNVVHAVKVLHRAVSVEERFLRRFQREAELLRQLDSPHIVRIDDVGEQDGLWFIVMEYVAGVTLARTIAIKDRLEVAEALEICRQVATGLASTNQAGIVHRDIKPANILIRNDGVAKIADFGIARASQSPSLTQADFVGTAFYAAPEQSNNEPVDIRADLYSLGVVMYEMLTGQLVFDGDTPLSVTLKHLYEPVPIIQRFSPDVPDCVASFCYKLLAKRPDHRYQTPEDVLDALTEVRRILGLPDPEAMAEALAAPRPQPRAEVTPSIDQRPAVWLETATGGRLAIPETFIVVTVGRTAPRSQVYPDVDLSPLPGSDTVSRRHARLVRQEGSWFVQEDESRHGTFLNGLKLEPGLLMPIENGDAIRLGRVDLTFRLHQPKATS